jgi:activating signal cointegrator complex subunit 3
MNYIAQNIGRIARALFEIALNYGWASLASQTLKICASIERQCWWEPIQSPLRQLVPKMLSWDLIPRLEDKMRLSSQFSCQSLAEMSPQELGDLVDSPKLGERISLASRTIPRLDVKIVSLQPITSGILKISIDVKVDFVWSSMFHGKEMASQTFWIWVEDQDGEWIYHQERFSIKGERDHRRLVQARDGGERIEMMVPILEPLPSQYFLRVQSDGWVGSVDLIPITLTGVVVLPQEKARHTDLMDLRPLHRRSLKNVNYEKLYLGKFDYFNPVQTQVFHHLYNTSGNALIGAPTGSGKTLMAELALLRLFSENASNDAAASSLAAGGSTITSESSSPRTTTMKKAVYVAPLKALVSERLRDWQVRLGGILGKNIVELTGDSSTTSRELWKADVVLTTPEKFDAVTRLWKRRSWILDIDLLIIDEIHLLGEDRGAILEVIISRMRRIHPNIRIIGLSTALANANDLGNWLGCANGNGLYNFRPSVRPVPLTCHIHGFPGKHYCPRMASMNKPLFQGMLTHSPDKPTLVFVASRRQTRLTALDLISLCVADESPKRFLGNMVTEHEMLLLAESVQDATLKHTLAFGIGLHHAGLSHNDRDVSERLFLDGTIKVLICTSTLAWGVNFPAHLVVIKGTEYFDATTKRYVPFPVTDVLQMMGRAGRPQFDTSGVCMILVHDELKTFYKKFLYEPFPVESHLPEFVHNHLLAEISMGGVDSIEKALEYLSWTYFFRRLPANPSFYDLHDSSPEAIASFLKEFLGKIVADLRDAKCLEVDTASSFKMRFKSTEIGDICTSLYLDYRTGLLLASKMTKGSNFLMKKVNTTSSNVAGKAVLGNAFDSAMLKMLRLLADCQEFHNLPVRHNEEEINAELMSLLTLKHPDPEDFSSPHVKAFLLLAAYIERLPELPIIDYSLDQKTVLDQATRVAAGVTLVALSSRSVEALICGICLEQMLVQACRYGVQGALSQLPARARKPVSSGNRVLPSQQLQGDNLLVEFLQGYLSTSSVLLEYAETAAKTHGEALPAFPNPTMTFEVEASRRSVMVSLKDSLAGTVASVQKLPKPKHSGWWLILVRQGSSVSLGELHLLDAKHIQSEPKGPIELAMTATTTTTSSNLNPAPAQTGRTFLLLLSDCYVGLDHALEVAL